MDSERKYTLKIESYGQRRQADYYSGSLDEVMETATEQYPPGSYVKIRRPGVFHYHGTLRQVIVALVRDHFLAPDSVDGWIYQRIMSGARPDAIETALGRLWVQRYGTDAEQVKYEEMIAKWQKRNPE
jgi:hypothetical protein